MEYNYSTPVKDSQQSGNYKLSKTHNQTREGDWICFNCNNLNFSFRKKCNRCKTQTRKQNQDLQNAYTLYYYNQQDGAMYSYQNGALYQPHESSYAMGLGLNEQEVGGGYANEHQTDNNLSFSRTHRNNNQIIEVTITSPFKDLLNSNQLIEDKINKKLRTPSSRKKKSHIKKNDLLPSVSPLLKKLLAKEDMSNKNNKENLLLKKDPLNVALFFDEIWNNNKENLLTTESNDHDNTICLTSSGKKTLRNSNIQKTNDSLCNFNSQQDSSFSYFLKSPQRDDQQEEIIEIDSEDQQLAQIINRIII